MELLRPVEFTQLYKSKLNGLGLLRVECCPKFIDYYRNGYSGGCLVISHIDKLEYEGETLFRIRINLKSQKRGPSHMLYAAIRK